MTEAPENTRELYWLLDELVSKAPRVRHAVLLSTDGLALATSSGMTREESEHVAAVASALNSLAKGAGRQFDAGTVRQTMVELEGGFLFVIAAGGGTCLAVFAEAGTDIGLVAYEMARLVGQVGEHMYTAPRMNGNAVLPERTVP
ncbi:roadblock/LC7 domain-containing protein [Prauserella muralis]|uniref:Dynein regulation protein LC7 n=1 Tax=Prauserella muralis TaxID=588067 RepID=A0A2V4APP5_9PSEU|nr:roadblock/LC7 domain-containing protein [Prauserella muralis]PXY22676.1 dynein regulation protein LC7 [Prauserella muralis]TWE28389.1 putative regulator of Ras-like GTPase activity (Roadblock/LC7/MglB family) [Prauserella muralis]